MKKITKSIISVVLAMTLLLGLAVTSFAEDMTPSIDIWDDNAGTYVAYYDLSENPMAAFVIKQGQSVMFTCPNLKTKLYIDENDCTPTKEDIKRWKKEDPTTFYYYYTINDVIQDYSVAVTYNAKKNKITVVSCETASAPTDNNEALQKYYEALAKQQKKK